MAPWTNWSRSRRIALALTVVAHLALYAVRDLGVPVTPLQQAAAVCDEALLSELLEASGDAKALVNPPTRTWFEIMLHGNTALHFAAANGHTKCVKALLAAGAPPTAAATLGPLGSVMVARPLYFAALGGHGGACSALLAAGAAVDVGLSFGPAGLVGGEAPLLAAVRGGHLACTRALLAAGASPKRAGGYTALHKAAAEKPAVAALLRERQKKGRQAAKAAAADEEEDEL